MFHIFYYEKYISYLKIMSCRSVNTTFLPKFTAVITLVCSVVLRKSECRPYFFSEVVICCYNAITKLVHELGLSVPE